MAQFRLGLGVAVSAILCLTAACFRPVDNPSAPTAVGQAITPMLEDSGETQAVETQPTSLPFEMPTLADAAPTNEATLGDQFPSLTPSPAAPSATPTFSASLTATLFPSATPQYVTPGAPLPPITATPSPTLVPGADTATPFGLPTPTPLPIEDACIYVIESGDTLFGVAIERGVTLEALLQANGLTANSVLQVGQEIRMPGCAPGASVATVDVNLPPTFTPSPTESVPTAIPTRLLLPIGGTPTTDPSQGVIPTTPTSLPGILPQNVTSTPTPLPEGYQLHIVGAGETLVGIAQRYRVTVNAIVRANNISNPNLLSLGQRLLIPPPPPTATPSS